MLCVRACSWAAACMFVGPVRHCAGAHLRVVGACAPSRRLFDAQTTRLTAPRGRFRTAATRARGSIRSPRACADSATTPATTGPGSAAVMECTSPHCTLSYDAAAIERQQL